MPSRLRVPAGYLLGLLVLVLARPRPTALAAAVPFALAGEALRVWASGHLDKTRALATGGPYAHTRNPLYLGSLLLAVALSVASSSAGATAAVAVYLLAFYPSVMREEARFLAAKFPATYESWAGAVPALVPRLRPAGPRESRFEWRRVRLNREWRTAAALPALALLLWARGAWS